MQMMQKLMMLAMGCLATIMVWGKSFSIDLRLPAGRNGNQAHARAKGAASLSDTTEGMLRRVNLDAGAADVGEVVVGDELTFALFDDVTLTLVLKKKMPSPLGGDVFLAAASGYDGVKNAVVRRTAEGLTIDVQDYRSKRVYKVISTAAGVTVHELEAKGGKCGCDALKPPNPTGRTSAKKNKAKRIVAGKGADTVSSIDILVAYDRNAAIWADANGGGITNFAETAVQNMNTALANTGLDDFFLFRLVGVTTVSVSAGNVQEALYALDDDEPGWADIKTVREAVGADIVTTLIDTGTPYGTTGVGWSLSTVSALSWFGENAYNVCAVQSVAQSHTMTHEVGHNLGCGHSDVQESSPGPQLYEYSAGYYFSAHGEMYHTIMAYDSEGPGGSEIPYFSSPDYTYQGVAVGNASHDNTRTIVNTYAAAADWRGSEAEGGSAAEEGGSAAEYEWEVEPSEDGRGCVIVSVSPSPAGSLTIPETVNGTLVVGIGYRAFYGMEGLTRVDIPDSVKNIGTEAFMGCEDMFEVDIPNSLTNVGARAFADCASLVSLTLPDGLASIGMSAFSGCKALMEMSIPASVANIGDSPFSGCERLRRFVVAEGNPSYAVANGLLCDKTVTQILACPGDVAYVTIPDSVEVIRTGAFCGCAMVNVAMGTGVRNIGQAAFSGCRNLIEMTIPASVRWISWDNPFEGCEKLERFTVADGNQSYFVANGLLCDKEGSSVVACPGVLAEAVVPAGIKSIGARAFGECGMLTRVVLPEGMVAIGYRAFENCRSMTSVDLPDSMASIEHGAFCDSGLTQVRIPNSVTNLGQYVFSGCTKLAAAVLGEGVTTIDFDLFGGCGRLTHMDIPDNVRNIRGQAFSLCSNLTDVVVGNGVTNIDGNAFGWCDALTNVVLGSSVESIQALAFQGCGHLTSITIPASVKRLGRDLFFPCGTSLRLETVRFLGRPPTMEEGSNEAFYRSLQIKGTYQPEFRDEWESALDGSGYWHWLVMMPDDEVVRVSFDANGGDGSVVMVLRRGVAIEFPTVSREGYALAGWWTAKDGGDQVAEGTLAAEDITYYAHWSLGFEAYFYSSPWAARDAAVNDGKLLFVLSGADWCPWTSVVKNYLETLGEAFFGKFVVYYCNVDIDEYGMADGVPSYGVFDPVKFNCNWWDGLLAYDSGGVAENVQAVIDKALAQIETSPTPTPAPEPTPTPAPEPTPTPEPTDGVVAGALDATFSKPQTVTGALYNKDNEIVGTVQVKAGKFNAQKWTVKFSASITLLLDGKVKKIMAKAVNLAPTSGRLAGLLSFKAPVGEMAFEMATDGSFTLQNASYRMVRAIVGGALKGGARGIFRMEGFDLAVPGEVQNDLLPREVAFDVAGNRWLFAKATNVRWVKDKATGEFGRVVDESNGKTNRSSLKLSYATKTGLFKGSFKAYALEDAPGGMKKLKKYVVNVIGLVVDGKGAGDAFRTRPAAGPWPVTVE